ncbi:endonuclease domain-containing protein [Agromyces arachidis]|uniref:endonuclease domain-containing protein n=1 Tax=Agromyces arachidis TaxID=766966 RepID=UPI004055E3CA
MENALALVAGCQPFERALAVWESALHKRVVSREVLARLPLGPQARRLLESALPFSDSGLETLVRTRLGWLRVRILAQAWIEGHRVDFLIADRLVLQIDGGHHVGGQRVEDNAHDAALMVRGYHVVRVGYRQVVDEWPSVQDVITRAIAQGLHLR